jgi:hypothetical protein
MRRATLRQVLTILAAIVFVAVTAYAGPVQAEPPLYNVWQEFAFPVPDDADCAGEDGVASGVLHVVEREFKKGVYGYHLNAKGIWKGDDTGIELLWRDNISEVVPVWGPSHRVGTTTQSFKIIGGPNGQFRLKVTAHIVEVGGQPVVYFEDVTTTCNV